MDAQRKLRLLKNPKKYFSKNLIYRDSAENLFQSSWAYLSKKSQEDQVDVNKSPKIFHKENKRRLTIAIRSMQRKFTSFEKNYGIVLEVFKKYD